MVRAAALVLAWTSAAMSASCGSSAPSGSATLAPGDFVVDAARGSADSRSGEPPATRDVATPAAPRASTDRVESRPVASDVSVLPAAGSPAARDLTARPGQPPLSADPGPTVRSIVVDAKVGDINNRAIFASDFFRPLENELRQRAAQLRRQRPRTAETDWARFARERIDQRLYSILEDEVFRSDFLANLKPEERAGLQNWLQNVQGNILRLNRGSRAITEERVRQETGQSLDDALKGIRDQSMTEWQIDQQIKSRVQVPWRDIRLAYERNNEVFNPPPKAFFRLIRVPKSDATGVETVREALASGRPFAEVAASAPNSFNTAEGGQVGAKEVRGDWSRAQVFPGELNAAALGLSEGQWAGPVPFEGDLAWVYLERVERVSIPLYDAQLSIEDTLRSERERREKVRYFAKLLDRASVTDFDEMADRLMQFAVERYWQPPPR